MANKDFEVQQLLKAYRKGVISEELFAQQMDGLVEGMDGTAVPNVFSHRSDGSKMANQMLGKTPQTESMVFTIPPGFNNDHENSHKGDQLIYVIEGTLEYEIAGKKSRVKAGDVLFVPAGTPHTATNIGSGNAAELATYVVEKGKPLITLVK